MNVVKIMKRENIYPRAKVRLQGSSCFRYKDKELRTVVYTVEQLIDSERGVSRSLESTRIATYYDQTCIHSVVVHTRWVNDE